MPCSWGDLGERWIGPTGQHLADPTITAPPWMLEVETVGIRLHAKRVTGTVQCICEEVNVLNPAVAVFDIDLVPANIRFGLAFSPPPIPGLMDRLRLFRGRAPDNAP